MPNKAYSIITIETDPELTLDELCQACDVTPDFIQELIQFGAIEPIDYSFRFNAQHLRRIRRVIHLQQDLEVNLAGAALAVDLMDQIEDLQTQVELLQKLLRQN